MCFRGVRHVPGSVWFLLTFVNSGDCQCLCRRVSSQSNGFSIIDRIGNEYAAQEGLDIKKL